MQVRLDPDIAKLVKRNADAHRRVFKRRRSYSAVVNEMLRERPTKVVARMFGDFGNAPAKHTP